MDGDAFFKCRSIKNCWNKYRLIKSWWLCIRHSCIKLCSSDIIVKLLRLIEQNAKNTLNLAFLSMCLYFLCTFLYAYNNCTINSESRITVLWSFLTWFSSLSGIHNKSQHNFTTSCLGGIFATTKEHYKSNNDNHRAFLRNFRNITGLEKGVTNLNFYWKMLLRVI